jgi:hypothetical protein
MKPDQDAVPNVVAAMKTRFSPIRPAMTAATLALLLAGASACSKSADNSANAVTAMPDNNAVPGEAMANAIKEEVAPSNETASATLPTDAWVGKWTGPEGLFLTIAQDPAKPGSYKIKNRDNLDREADYTGVAEAATIRFVRDGKDMVIQPGSGADTGFKWLADKKDCLIVIKGQEGYCRD